jgi:magnesium-transporting ATPase (P-type)
MAYATLALAELAMAFSIRSASVAAWRLPTNPWLISSTVGAAIFVLLSIYLPPVHEAFATVSLDVSALLLVAALASLPLVVVEVIKALRSRVGPALPLSARPHPEIARF